MKKRTLIPVIAAVTAAAALSGCGGPSSQTEAAKASQTGTSASDTAAAGQETAGKTDASAGAGDAAGQTITFWHSMGGVNG